MPATTHTTYSVDALLGYAQDNKPGLCEVLPPTGSVPMSKKACSVFAPSGVVGLRMGVGHTFVCRLFAP